MGVAIERDWGSSHVCAMPPRASGFGVGVLDGGSDVGWQNYNTRRMCAQTLICKIPNKRNLPGHPCTSCAGNPPRGEVLQCRMQSGLLYAVSCQVFCSIITSSTQCQPPSTPVILKDPLREATPTPMDSV